MINMLFAGLFTLIALPILLMIGMWLNMRRRFPHPPREEPPHRLTPSRWRDDEVTVGWVGHSTVLINLYGVKILTDPVLGPQIGVQLGPWQIGPKSMSTRPLILRNWTGSTSFCYPTRIWIISICPPWENWPIRKHR